MVVNLPTMYPEMLREQKLLPKPVKPGPWSQGALKPVGKRRTEQIERTVIGQCVVWEGNGMVPKFKEWVDHKGTLWRERHLKDGPLSTVEVEAWDSVAEDGCQPVGIFGKCKTWGKGW